MASWLGDTARAVSDAARQNPGLTGDRLRLAAEGLYNKQQQVTAATTSGNSYEGLVYKYRAAQEARNAKAASIVAGTAHDVFRLQPKGLPPQAMAPIVSVNDQYYEKVDQAEAVGNFRLLPRWQQIAWANAAEALGGGTRTAESTYANYVEMSGYLTSKGMSKDPLDLLMEDIDSGYMPKNLLSPDFEDESSGSSFGGGGFGGGGFGGGGGGAGQINLMNESDARAVVNSLASEMLGRTVSEGEFRQYYKSLLDLQKKNPSTVEVDAEGNTVVNEAIGADGLRYNLEEQMRNTEDFVTNSIGTQALDLLESYLNDRRIA